MGIKGNEVRAGGDFDYDRHGKTYSRRRQTDPRIAAHVHAALGDARTVLNVGAGAGSYEPLDRHVIAIEPSAVMRSQRPPHLVPAINAFAENLPLDDQVVDAAMAMITIHQWADLQAGIGELKRVTRGPIVILTFDGEALDDFWLARYVPELIAAERGRYPLLSDLCHMLGVNTAIRSIPIPGDCVDGFTEAFYARPELLLEPEVRASQSAWGFVDSSVPDRFVRNLRADLKSGAWASKYGHLRNEPQFHGSLRLVVSHPEGR